MGVHEMTLEEEIQQLLEPVTKELIGLPLSEAKILLTNYSTRLLRRSMETGYRKGFKTGFDKGFTQAIELLSAPQGPHGPN